MVNKKLKYQKSALSLTVIFLAMIIGFVIINAGINFMLIGVEKYDVQVDDKYNTTFEKLYNSQAELNATVNEVKKQVTNTTVEQGALQTFWNSFKGLGSVLKIPIKLINVSLNSISAFTASMTILPPWSVDLIIMLIIILIGLSIVGAMTGGNSNV